MHSISSHALWRFIFLCRSSGTFSTAAGSIGASCSTAPPCWRVSLGTATAVTADPLDRTKHRGQPARSHDHSGHLHCWVSRRLRPLIDHVIRLNRKWKRSCFHFLKINEGAELQYLECIHAHTHTQTTTTPFILFSNFILFICVFNYFPFLKERYNVI